MAHLLKKARIIATGECDCRRSLKNCDHTLEGCLFLNRWGKAAIEKGYAKKSNFKKALAILKKTYDEGLVLIAGTEDPPVKICSCCSCCCFLFAGQLRFGMKDSIMRSAFIAQINNDLCQACGTCILRCQFSALTKTNGKVSLNRAKCFGCGLCIGKCPNHAIRLVKR